MMLTVENQQIMTEIAALSQKTGAAILSYYDDPKSYHIQHKGNHTPLTDADLAAHDLLLAGLPQIINLPCLSEESPPEVHFQPPADYWLIDPIDGTREFIERTGEFCILITRIKNGNPILSFTYMPITGEYWFAVKNQGAYKKEPMGEVKRLSCRTAKIDALTIILARPKLSQRVSNYLAENFPNYQLICSGSGLKFCAIAEGRADVYPKLSPTTSQWDVAAGDLLLQEAGGCLRFLGNKKPIYGVGEVLNPPFLAFGGGFAAENIERYFQAMNEVIYGKTNSNPNL